MDTKAIEELIAIMDKAELTALRVDDGETKIELERNHGPLSSTALPLMADRVSALLAGKKATKRPPSRTPTKAPSSCAAPWWACSTSRPAPTKIPS